LQIKVNSDSHAIGTHYASKELKGILTQDSSWAWFTARQRYALRNREIVSQPNPRELWRGRCLRG